MKKKITMIWKWWDSRDFTLKKKWSINGISRVNLKPDIVKRYGTVGSHCSIHKIAITAVIGNHYCIDWLKLGGEILGVLVFSFFHDEKIAKIAKNKESTCLYFSALGGWKQNILYRIFHLAVLEIYVRQSVYEL